MKCGRERRKDESRPTVERDGSTVEFLGYDILLKDGKSSVNVTNNYNLNIYNNMKSLDLYNMQIK